MCPEESEHTKEPAYEKDYDWPPVFHLPPYSDLNGRSPHSGGSNASGSQDGSDITETVSSNHTTPHLEDETSQECSVAEKGNAEVTTIEPILPQQEWLLSEQKSFDTVQTASINMPALVDLKQPTSLATSVKHLSSGNVVAEGGSHVSKNQLHESETSLLEGNVVPTDPASLTKCSEIAMELRESDAVDTVVSCNRSGCSGAEKVATQAGLKVLANSHSNGVTTGSMIVAEKGQMSINIEASTDIPSIATSCSTTTYTTDPPSTRLRHMIANSPSIILCPGVYDGLSARIALHVGFEAMYMTGAGTTASCLGASDLGIAHLHEMRTNAEMIANLQPDGPPLLADMDTGYGGPLVISRAVKQYARAGVAAFHIEDQVPEKRCGHLAGKEVVDVDTYLRRLRACLDAREQIRSDIIIIARTDALQSCGYSECVERLRRARDVGADMGILEGVPSKEMAAQAVKDLAPWPLCYNSVENGHSPLITAAEAQAMGYRLMVFSFAGIAPAYMAILKTFTKLKEEGVTGSIVGPKTIFEVCGLEEEMRIDEAAGGSAFAKGV